jgi:hypothetical protein
LRLIQKLRGSGNAAFLKKREQHPQLTPIDLFEISHQRRSKRKCANSAGDSRFRSIFMIQIEMRRAEVSPAMKKRSSGFC